MYFFTKKKLIFILLSEVYVIYSNLKYYTTFINISYIIQLTIYIFLSKTMKQNKNFH